MDRFLCVYNENIKLGKKLFVTDGKYPFKTYKSYL